MAAAFDVARSRVEVVAPPMQPWRGVIDEGAAIVELQDLSCCEGRLVLHGVEPSAAPALRRILSPYRHFVGSAITHDRFDDIFELSPEPLRWSECARIEERCALFLSPWHLDNAFHLHCDNLLPIFANLRRGGLLDAPRLLCLYEGDISRNTHAVQLWALMAELFDGAVESASALRASRGRIGFRRVRWGRGPAIPYLRELRDTPYDGVMAAYREWVLRRLGVVERAAVSAEAAPRLLYLERSDARRIANPELLVEAFAALGHTLRFFAEWDTIGPRDLVALAHDADVLLGVHGAALVHMIYQPAGSVVVEFMMGRRARVPVYQNLSPLCGHRHVRIDLLQSAEGEGCVISRARAAAIARRVLHEWRRRKSPIPVWERCLEAAHGQVWRLRRLAQRFRSRRGS